MTQAPSQRPVVQTKPQPDVYTLMLVVSVIAVAVTLGFVILNLMSPPPNGYGLTVEVGLIR